MNRARVLGGMFSAGVLRMLGGSAFPAQQPPPPAKEQVPPENFDPGFVPGSGGPQIQKFNKDQLKLIQQVLPQSQIPAPPKNAFPVHPNLQQGNHPPPPPHPPPPSHHKTSKH